MIGDTKLALDHSSNALTGPEVTPEAIGGSTVSKQAGNRALLLLGEPWCRTAAQATPQSIGAPLTGALDPLAHRAFGHPQSSGNVLLLPSGSEELPGT